MAPVIRISDENWERLKHWAVPLEDSVDDALSRVLAAAAPHMRQSQNGQLARDDDHPEGTGPDNLNASSARTSHGGAETRKRRRRGKGRKVPQSEYELPILQSLDKLGGKARVSDVLDEVKRRMEPLLGEVDYEFPKTATEERWRNTARWARAALIQRDWIKGNSERGVWELTSKGRAEARSRNSQ